VDFSPGALIDVEGAGTTLVGSSDGDGQWAGNCASLNVAAGSTFDAARQAIVLNDQRALQDRRPAGAVDIASRDSKRADSWTATDARAFFEALRRLLWT
jgi:hypothetical protein